MCVCVYECACVHCRIALLSCLLALLPNSSLALSGCQRVAVAAVVGSLFLGVVTVVLWCQSGGCLSCGRVSFELCVCVCVCSLFGVRAARSLTQTNAHSIYMLKVYTRTDRHTDRHTHAFGVLARKSWPEHSERERRIRILSDTLYCYN